MSKAALFIKHRALPGKRDEVRRIWEQHLKPRVVANHAHEAYFYCYDDNDPDTICVFQQYVDRASSQEFLEAPHIADGRNTFILHRKTGTWKLIHYHESVPGPLP